MLAGFLSLFRALGLFRVHPRLLLVLMLAPWAINLILFLGAWSAFTVWMTGMVEPYLEALASGWWQTLLVGFGNFVAVVLAAGVAYFITIIGAVLVAAPFHDRLSAAVERAARPASAAPVRRMGVLAAFREGARTALVLVVSEVALLPLLLFPGVGQVLFALLSALVLTLGILDVPLARHELTLGQKAAFAWRNLPRLMGLSLGVLAVSPVPFLNLITLPVIVMAATLLVVEAEVPLA